MAFENIIKGLSSKRVIGVVVKWKYPFFTELQNLQKPKDAALVGIFGEPLKQKIPDHVLQFFDVVVWFEADYAKFESVYTDANCITLPEIEPYISKIVEIAGPEKIQIFETEEFLIEPICQVREKFNIPGPRSSDLLYLRDKAILKALAEEKQLPTMKYALFTPSEVTPEAVEAKIQEILTRVQTFPMFRKPTNGCGSGGGGQLNSEAELREFVKTEVSKHESEAKYLIEECIESEDIAEFWACAVLLADGTIKPYYIILCKRGMTNVDHLKTGYPMRFYGATYESVETEFPNLSQFVLNVTTKLNPPKPHVFCVQGFQKHFGSPDYLLTEVAYRINGGRGTPVGYYGAGISPETALIACHIDPDYKVEPDPARPRFHRMYLWYPQVAGTLVEQNGLPEGHPVTSRVDFAWAIPVGTKCTTAASFAHFALTLTIDHDDADVLERDVTWLEENWRPRFE
uniref:ATP-grasp domain-containing protein n=1 Tax=Panagrellus redivivus TaxID=6233 RepID=A0A7E4VKI8_PANRE